MRYLTLLLCLCLTGCDWYDSRGRPKLEQGESKETQSIQQKRNVEAEINVQYSPAANGQPGPVTEMDFFDSKIKVPANTKVQAKVTSNYRSKQSDWYELIGTFDHTSSKGQWIFIGILCIAGGGVLIYLGITKPGIGLIIFGVLIIACALAVEKYPGLFIGFLFLCILAVVAFIIYSYRNKTLTTTKTDMETTLTALCEQIDALKKIDPVAVKTHITDALAKSYKNDVIAKVTRAVRKKP